MRRTYQPRRHVCNLNAEGAISDAGAMVDAPPTTLAVLAAGSGCAVLVGRH